ncbi:SDR family oxidoreductase [Cognatishimia activa]|uniref:SDR family oxidoreductase n=1 Tax=Cognatishimia activa TaxID=1715691 RepID=UPI00222E713C|nr:SDR family NAD(P)-dependent oxidoreductase [Cognatishimia activa]UZD92411.1 SDR family NAD(P)-dependent oxidoreductase [Cognatishimia activa]
MNLNASKILITGGARGIGLELSKQLIEKGASIVAVGRSLDSLEALKVAYPDRVAVYQADLSQSREVDALLKTVATVHPDINVLINNAAVQFEMDVFSEDNARLIELARREIDLNLSALVALTIGFLPILRVHKASAIVNIGSGLALAPKAASPTYCGTKAALRSFTKALRYQCQSSAPHIHVCEAIMALVETDMTAGRGSGKITAAQAANEVLAGLERERAEVWVEKAKTLRILNRLSPAIAERIMR